MRLVPLLAVFLALSPPSPTGRLLAEEPPRDIVVYGGTSAGVIAAIQAREMGRSVVLIEPSAHLGGLTTGGLGATDIGNKAAIGGKAREFYRRVGAHYARPEAWRWQARDSYRSPRQAPGENEMWTFEPHVAEAIIEDLVREAGVPVVRQERLDLEEGVVMDGPRIRAIRMESGRVYRGSVFIDATYEGDLLALAGVSYHVGRESNATWGETLNGVQTQNARYHQIDLPVDPWIRPGDPSSGLLPGVHGDGPGEEGSGDDRVQAYNFRVCLTDHPENRIPFEQPPDYDARDYELLLRYFDAGFDKVPWHHTAMPNRKTDTNNNHGFSTDFIGANYDYPEGDYEARARIVAAHERYQRGLLWCLANEERVPEAVRREASRWGLSKDEFLDSGHWPHQLYVREARRMVSDRVMTQHDCQGRVVATDPVGLAAYTMDSHNVQRYVRDGRAVNEGDVQVGGFPPYPIAFGSLVPKRAECVNLVVPVCLSASHIAFGSIRMEPVFMVLGQSAATIAAHALDEDVAVQDLDYPRLRARLIADGQVLAWTGPSQAPGVASKSLPGIVVDDRAAELSGPWVHSTSTRPFVDEGYRHDGDTAKGRMAASFPVRVPRTGDYELRLAYSPHANRARSVPVVIETTRGRVEVRVDQTRAPTHGAFTSLGAHPLRAGIATVTVVNRDTSGHVIVDAVQAIPLSEP